MTECPVRGIAAELATHRHMLHHAFVRRPGHARPPEGAGAATYPTA
ncbi:hypothetical protein [Kitasatospora sp. NPDC094015]